VVITTHVSSFLKAKKHYVPDSSVVCEGWEIRVRHCPEGVKGIEVDTQNRNMQVQSCYTEDSWRENTIERWDSMFSGSFKCVTDLYKDKPADVEKKKVVKKAESFGKAKLIAAINVSTKVQLPSASFFPSWRMRPRKMSLSGSTS